MPYPPLHSDPDKDVRVLHQAFAHEKEDLWELVTNSAQASGTSNLTLAAAVPLLEELLPRLFTTGFRAGFQAAVLAFQEGRLRVDPPAQRDWMQQ